MFIQPPATLVLGDTGTGKTSMLATAIKAGLEVFVCCTEPTGVESLIDSCKRVGADISKMHWTTALPSTQGWQGLIDMANVIGTSDFEQIQKIKSGVGKNETRHAATKLLNSIANFTCERDGRSYGDMTKWGPDRLFALDSLSGLSVISWALTVGYKPTAHQGEWNIAMNFIRDLLMKITSDRQCHFVLTAHLEVEADSLTGVPKQMASTLGRKLAPSIPRFFSDVVVSKKTVQGGKADFTWSTMDNMVALKNRNLPLADKLPQDYSIIEKAFTARLSTLAAAQQPSSVNTQSAVS